MKKKTGGGDSVNESDKIRQNKGKRRRTDQTRPREGGICMIWGNKAKIKQNNMRDSIWLRVGGENMKKRKT